MLDQFNVTVISFRPLRGYTNTAFNFQSNSISNFSDMFVHLAKEEIEALEKHFVRAVSDRYYIILLHISVAIQ